MKKVAALIFFCSTTFLMGMETNTNRVDSKSPEDWCEFSDSTVFCLFGIGNESLPLNKPLIGKCSSLAQVLRKITLGKPLDEVLKNKNLYEDLCLKLGFDSKNSEHRNKLDFLPRDLRNNEDYKNLEIILNYVSDQSELIYKELSKELRTKKEKYYSIGANSPPLCYSHNHNKIGIFGTLAFGVLSGLGVGYVSKKIFGQSGFNAEMQGGNTFVACSTAIMDQLMPFKDKDITSRRKNIETSTVVGALGIFCVPTVRFFFDYFVAPRVLKKEKFSLKDSAKESLMCSFLYLTSGFSALVLSTKLFRPYEEKFCVAYEKKKKFKEEYEKNRKKYEKLKNLTYKICRDASLKAHSLKPMFQSYIREEEYDKLGLLDLTIKITEEGTEKIF